MELHRLDGFDATGIDTMDIMGIQSTEEPRILGSVADAPEIAYEILDENGNVVMYADVDENIYVIDGLGGFFKKIGKGLKKFSRKVIKPVVKTFNRFLNPATILLRNGFLLAMKTNLMKVAERLRFGYLSETEARKRGGNMSRFAKLRKAVEKAEKIYELAGGKARNLKKAILSGKGNKDRKVPLSGFGLGNPNLTEGPALYADPFEKFVLESDPETVEAFLNNEISVEGLGAVASSTAIATASGAVAGVSALLSKIGNVFGQAQQVKNQATTIFSKPKPQAHAIVPFQNRFPITSKLPPLPNVIRRNEPLPSASKRFNFRNSNPSGNNTISNGEKNFFQKNKTAIVAGVGVLVVGTGIAIAMRSNKKKPSRPVSGLPAGKAVLPKRKKKRTMVQRDELGRFTSTSRRKKTGARRKRKIGKARKAPERLVPKALL